ncbi:MAG: farnesyl diphosphate synthase [Woeseiaceae bacterium]
MGVVLFDDPEIPGSVSLPGSCAEKISAYSQRISERLDRALPAAGHMPQRLHEAMRYAVLNGGKRVRPLLVYATGECLGIEPGRLDAPAVAIELIHAFSLVHDDLPAMDDDDLRRGEPTVHRKFDEATAILAADALQPLAFSVLTSSGIEDRHAVQLVRLVADACGSLGMTGGQAIDLSSEGRSLSRAELEQMHALKTGALIHASVMAACCLDPGPGRSRCDALDRFAERIGLAFQIKDDILDVEGETGVIGKRAGADQVLGKATWPSLFGLEESKKRCDELLADAIACLDSFGKDAATLRWLARYIVERVQ